MDLDCHRLASVGSKRSCSGDSMAGLDLSLAAGDLCEDTLEMWLLAGDDDVEPRVSILSSIWVIRPLRLCNSFNICLLVSIGVSLSFSTLQFLFMGLAW